MKTFWIGLVVIIIIILGGFWYWHAAQAPTMPAQTATSTPSAASSTSETTSDGTVTFARPADFGLAVTPEQVLVQSYIPPCEENFNYCLYYNGGAYQGTNFESAGLSIAKRPDLTTEQTCINTPPAGYDMSIQPDNATSTADYSTSVFSNVGDAAAGHFASGTLYRLFVKSNAACEEFLLRIGQTDYNNYPAGAVTQFTDADQQALEQDLAALLNSITLANGESIQFPSAQ